MGCGDLQDALYEKSNLEAFAKPEEYADNVGYEEDAAYVHREASRVLLSDDGHHLIYVNERRPNAATGVRGQLERVGTYLSAYAIPTLARADSRVMFRLSFGQKPSRMLIIHLSFRPTHD